VRINAQISGRTVTDYFFVLATLSFIHRTLIRVLPYHFSLCTDRPADAWAANDNNGAFLAELEKLI
jgi:hypothetical protein